MTNIPTFPQAGEVLRGADRIAEFLFGTPDDRRTVYHLIESGSLPIFRLNSTICARKSTLLKWLEEQEAKPQPAKAPKPEPGAPPRRRGRPRKL